MTPPGVCGGNSLVCCHVGADSISARAVRVTTNPRGRDSPLPCDTPKAYLFILQYSRQFCKDFCVNILHGAHGFCAVCVGGGAFNAVPAQLACAVFSGGAGTVAFEIGVGWIEPRGMVIRQYVMRNYAQEADILSEIAALAARADTLVTFNGKSFDLPLLESRIAACENALSTLMGEFPQREGHIERTAIAQAAMTTDSDLPLGLPASLLARRPDISALAERMTAAAARVGVAWANRLPTLGISITGGWENDDANRLISSPFSLLAASLTGPVFDFGSRKASQNKAVAEYEQARLAYEQGVLVAFREAADALMNYRKSRQSRALKAQSQRAAGKYLHLATLQYEGGTTNYMDVLDAQRRNFSAQIDYSNALRDESLALISLYKALGGGW